MDAWKQLQAYAERHDEEAFAGLVTEHLSMVYSTARRQLGDSSAAEEVTQAVFLALAQKAATLQPTGSLAGWLYRVACLKAKSYQKREMARRRRETKAYEMNTVDPAEELDPDADWDQLEPLLDKAMNALSESDRTAIILRYFQKQPFRQVGESLGVSENAARMRVDRSVERLRVWFHQRGIACSSIALGMAIGAQSAHAVPATLTPASIQAVIAQAGLSASIPATLTTLMASTKTLFASALLLGTLMPIALPRLGGTAEVDVPPTRPITQPLELPLAATSGLIAQWESLMADHGPADGSFANVYEAINDVGDDFRRRAFRGALIAEWITRDPAEALSYLRAHDDGRVTICLREWLKVDSVSATAAMRDDTAGLRESINSLLEEIAEVQPDVVPGLVEGVEKRGWKSPVRDAFATLAAANHRDALATAQSLPEEQRQEALAGVAQGWAKNDGLDALSWAQGLDETVPGKGTIMRQLLIGWAESDPGAALDHLAAAPPGSNEGYGSDTGEQVIQEAAKTDFQATLAWLEENRGKLGRDSLLGLSDAIGKRLRQDTAATLDMIRDHPAQADLLPGLQHELINDGYRERKAVWNWLANQEESELVQSLRRSLLTDVAGQEPELVMTWLEESSDRLDPREAYNAIAAMFRRGEGLATVEGLLDKAPDGLRNQLLAQSFANLYNLEVTSMEKWVDLLDELPESDQQGASIALARKWAEISPSQAIAWTETLEDQNQSTRALAGAVSHWARVDSYEVSQWISELPAGTRRDHATQSLVSVIVEAEPDSAWAWAKTIGDAKLRAASLRKAFRQMDAQDTRQANAWLQDPSLSKEDFESLTAITASP